MQILIPAAGASRRMQGPDKLALIHRGEALLTHAARIARAACPDVLVLLRPDDPRHSLLHGLDVARLEVPEAAEGLGATLRAGAGAGRGALMVLPADLPFLGEDDLRQMIAAHALAPHAILRATDPQGRSGHPVIFPADLRPAFAALSGDEGARRLLTRHADRLQPFPLFGRGATADIDTPEDWQAIQR